MSSLNHLCRICNTNPPKYQCPRCRSRTCSLTCYKRHQKWYSCSGKRDPAAYMPRNQLATAKGIDHDFNFLTGIERSFDRADRDVEDRGIDLEPSSSPFSAGNTNMQRALDATGVFVHKAPKGMSRERQNKTKWDYKRKSLRWSVEWVLPDFSKQLDSILENNSLASGFGRVYDVSQPAKRRKLEGDCPESASVQQKGDAIEYTHGQTQQGRSEMEDTENCPHDGLSKRERKTLHFYLHKPFTSSASRVLIPLPQTAILSKYLKGRDVLEFPTIYALKQQPSELPEGYILEREYLKQRQKLVQEVDDALGTGYDHSKLDDQSRVKEQAESDYAPSDSRILESLQRDIDVVKQYI